MLGLRNLVIDPIGELLSFAERSYVRMQAEQLILQCLQDRDPKPFYSLVNELVAAGAPSLAIVREVQEVLRFIKTQLTRDGRSVREDLVEAMAEFGVYIPEVIAADSPVAFHQMCNRSFREDVRKQGAKLEVEDVDLLEEICLEAGEKVTVIAARMSLLGEMESAIKDWLAGLAYEAAHSPDPAWERRSQPNHWQ